MQNTPKALLLNPIHRIAMLGLIILQFVLFSWAVVLLLNYCMLKMPFIEFESLTSPNSNQPHFITNSCLYILFWVQHILMATSKYKIRLYKRVQYFVLYERYIFNNISGLTLWFIFSQVEPSKDELFTLPWWFCLIMTIYGFVMLTISMKELGSKIFMPYNLGQIISSKYLTYDAFDSTQQNLKVDGIYAYLRHPMQAAFLSIIFFSHNVYTVDKLLFSVIMGGGILMGIHYEEKRMAVQFKDFREYKERVKYRFLPFL